MNLDMAKPGVNINNVVFDFIMISLRYHYDFIMILLRCHCDVFNDVF